MTTALAILSSSEIDPQTAFSALKSIEQTIQNIDSTTLLVDIIDRAQLAEQWLKIKNVASEVAVQASRVQLVALRRIGQLDAVLADEKAQKFALRLAALTDARFLGELDALERPIKAATFLQNIDNAHRYATQLNIGFDISNGHVRQPDELWALSQQRLLPEREREYHRAQDRRRNELRLELIANVLDDLYEEGDPFSVSEATEKMLELLNEQLGPEDSFFGDPRNSKWNGHRAALVREGLESALRHAINTSVSSDDVGDAPSLYCPSIDEHVRPPKFVTYQDPDVGWVRIPWGRAGLSQLQEMAALRRLQVKQLAAKAEELSALTEELEKVNAVSPAETKCAPLLLVAIRSVTR